MQRKYLPTFAELLDRLSILNLKHIFIPENEKTYQQEILDILHDIDMLMAEMRFDANTIQALLVLATANTLIWKNEELVRKNGGDGNLRLSHAINGVRNLSKNVISKKLGEKLDLKIDCLAEFPEYSPVFTESPNPPTPKHEESL